MMSVHSSPAVLLVYIPPPGNQKPMQSGALPASLLQPPLTLPSELCECEVHTFQSCEDHIALSFHGF